VETARGGEGRIDDRIVDTVTRGIEKADFLTGPTSAPSRSSAPASPAKYGPKSMTGICDAAAV